MQKKQDHYGSVLLVQHPHKTPEEHQQRRKNYCLNTNGVKSFV